jgi:hypothetical protein
VSVCAHPQLVPSTCYHSTFTIFGPRALGAPEDLVCFPAAHGCLPFVGTGAHCSQITGMGMGSEEARTVPTSPGMDAGTMMCVRGSTTGSARQSWARPARSLPPTNLFPRCLELPWSGIENPPVWGRYILGKFYVGF